MGEITDAIEEVDVLTRSLEDSSVSREIDVEKGCNYVIDDEERLPFDCKKVLGRGLSAVVERVEHKRTKEAFAKKVIPFPRGKSKSREQAEERYYNEAAIIRTLNPHHHVIELFATYTTPRSGGLILRPAANQGDLQQYLDDYDDALDNVSTAPFVVARMTKVLEQAFGCLSSALKYMHETGIRHKDIKPGNILVHEGVVVYTDFGASKDTKKDGQCTTEGRPDSMTRRYCAPEVLEYDKRNFAADVFSLGCVFFEMLLRLSRLTEHKDKEDEGYPGIMDAIHTLLPTAEVPPNLLCLSDIIILMTAKDPLRRPLSEEIAANVCSREGLSCLKCHIDKPRILPRPMKLERLDYARRQPEWNHHFQRYLYLHFDYQHQHWYWNHHDGKEPAERLCIMTNRNQEKTGYSSTGSHWILYPLSPNPYSMTSRLSRLGHISASTVEPRQPVFARVQRFLAPTMGKMHYQRVITNLSILVCNHQTSSCIES